jgi:hypothetical protein
MADASEYLLEITAHDGSGVVTLRLSSSGYRTGPGDTPANTVYDRAIKDPGNFTRSLFEDGKTMGQSQTATGEIVLTNAEGRLDSWLTSYGFSGRAILIKRLSSEKAAFSSAETIFKGTIESVDSPNALEAIVLRLADRRLELQKPLQNNRYGGTTTSGAAVNVADGTADMKDQPKPLNYGKTFGVKPATANPFDLIYQVHDGAVAAIVVYDGGVPLTNAGNFATAALLKAAVLVPGKYATCLSLGLFRLGGSPFFQVTADVTEGATAAQRTAASCVDRMMTKMGLNGPSNMSGASFTALSTLAPQEVGIFVNDDTHAIDVMSAVLASVGGWIAPNNLGVFELGRLSAPAVTAAWTLRLLDQAGASISLIKNPDSGKKLPFWRVILKYARVWEPLRTNGIGAYVSETRKSFLSAEWRESKSDQNSVLTKHLLAEELSIETLLTTQADADAEAARRLALYSVDRLLLTCDVSRTDAVPMTMGSTGTVTWPRYGFASGKNMVVIGRREDPARERVELTLWG